MAWVATLPRNKRGTTTAPSAGFTLIEILCALAVLAIVMGVALRILSGSTAAVVAIDESEAMVALAESHMAERMSDETLAIGEHAGTSGPLVWHEIISPANDVVFANGRTAKVIALRVDVSVHAPSGRQYQLRSVRLERIR
jgi:prepilin-type N-terminal cleavage/methylation domain-containing protein